MSIMVSLDFPMQEGKQAVFLETFGTALPDTRGYDGCIKVETFAEEDGSSVILVKNGSQESTKKSTFSGELTLV